MTIKDLADLSGYAVGTVSRVLNNQPNVSEKARKHILEVARAAGYEPNSNAKNLRRRHSNTVLVVVRGARNGLFSALVEQLQRLSAESSCELVVDYIDELGNEVHRARKLCREIKPLGILFLGGNEAHFREEFAEIPVPAVLVTNTARRLEFPNLSSVATDDRAAAAAAIRLLTENGHKKIAVIGGDPEHSDTSRLRLEGCREEMLRQGIPFDPARQYRAVRYSMEGGYGAMQSILRDFPEVTAVFAASDVMAIGAIRAAFDAGRRVPGDISVVGFDGLPICAYYRPRLTTVVQQLSYLSETSFRLLREAVAGGVSARHILAPFTLSRGDSVQKYHKKDSKKP